jgi:hypothetical protein
MTEMDPASETSCTLNITQKMNIVRHILWIDHCHKLLESLGMFSSASRPHWLWGPLCLLLPHGVKGQQRESDYILLNLKEILKVYLNSSILLHGVNKFNVILLFLICFAFLNSQHLCFPLLWDFRGTLGAVSLLKCQELAMLYSYCMSGHGGFLAYH